MPLQHPQNVNPRERKVINKTLVNKIIDLKDENGQYLHQKYSIDSVLTNIEKHQIQIVELFSKYLK